MPVPTSCRSCGAPIPRKREGSLGRIPLCCRFWAKVDVRGPDECWPWIAQRLPFGHGMISAPGRDGKPLLAHRVALELAGVTLGARQVGMHVCDFPPCVNVHPRHVQPGTQVENLEDARSKGRMRPPAARRGEANPFAKLTDQTVRRIRAMYATGHYTQREVAEKLGTTRASVCDVVTRRRWRHVA